METSADTKILIPTTMIMTTTSPTTTTSGSRRIPKTWNLQDLTPTPVCPLDQVMSEELAKALQDDEEQAFKREIQIATEKDTGGCVLDEAVTPQDCSPTNMTEDDSMIGCESDLLLAQMLQAEFDKEHDAMLKTEEKKFNGTSKVTVSFVNYRKVPDGMMGNEDDSSNDEDICEPRHLDSFDYAGRHTDVTISEKWLYSLETYEVIHRQWTTEEKNSPNIGKNGMSISKQSNVITTKHDATICGHRNACRVMEFPPGIETGDGGGFDMKLSNRVFNKLKVYSASEEKRSKRLHDKVEKSTAIQVLDPKTRLLLFKMVNSEILESIHGCISTGKESVVFHSFGGQTSEMKVPAECAIKVFKTTLNEFKNRDKYIRDDFRFKDRFTKQNPRKIIRQWAEKEMHNLSRLHKFGVNCPQVVVLKKHILVMSFIGQDQTPAPKLKEVKLSSTSMQKAYEQIVEIMKRMFNLCHLVHADLSEYNILWHDNLPWIIDVSQAVDRNHPQALEFLLRDCTNITSFFGKNGVSDVSSAEQLFQEITGLDLPSKGGGGTELLARLHDYERDQELLTFGVTDKPFPFHSVFEKRASHEDRPSESSE